MAFVYYTAVSLDGFVADATNSLEWLFRYRDDPEGPMGWETFERRIGALVMGRRTFDWLSAELERTGAAWPHAQPCWVLTHRPAARPTGADVRFTDAGAEQVHVELRRAAGDRDVWCVGGGATASQFAAADLLDEIWVSIAPCTLGGGVPLLAAQSSWRTVAIERNGDLIGARLARAGDPTGPRTGGSARWTIPPAATKAVNGQQRPGRALPDA